MKPLVFASYAQFGVDAGGVKFWTIAMACDIDPEFLGDLCLW